MDKCLINLLVLVLRLYEEVPKKASLFRSRMFSEHWDDNFLRVHTNPKPFLAPKSFWGSIERRGRALLDVWLYFS